MSQVILEHVAVEGWEFMPSGWCGGCEHCISYPPPTVCLACSYGRDGYPAEAVSWPCAVHTAPDRARRSRMRTAYRRRNR
jgi:hypothetical protein